MNTDSKTSGSLLLGYTLKKQARILQKSVAYYALITYMFAVNILNIMDIGKYFEAL